MLISAAAARAVEDVSVRERDVMQAFTPGAAPERGDVAKPERAQTVADPLCAAPPPGTYFVTSDDRGRRLYTRDGSFSFSGGVLVDTHGHPMLGYASDGAPLSPLRADPVDTALGYARGAQVDAGGVVSYERAAIDPRTGRSEPQRTVIGQLALARFAPATKLQAVDPQHAAAPPGILPHVGRPGDGNFAALVPFARESSGIDVDRGLRRLQEAYLAVDAIRAAVMAQNGLDKGAMDLLK